MPATVEALLIAVVFVMPGFILVRTREWFVPPVAKSDAMSLTLTSITVSLAFVPLWLAAAPDLLDVRHRLTTAAAAASAPSVPLGHRGVVAFFALSLLLPVSGGLLAAIAYWQDWYPKLGGRLLPRLGIPAPSRGVGENISGTDWGRSMWAAGSNSATRIKEETSVSATIHASTTKNGIQFKIHATVAAWVC